MPKDKIEPEAFQTNIQKIVGSYKEDFLFKGLNKFSNLIEGSNVTDKDWEGFIKNDPKEMFKAETSKENKKSLHTKNLLFNQYNLSSTKYNFNAGAYNFYLRENYFPGQRMPPVNSLEELASTASRDELLLTLLTSPSFKELTQYKGLIRKIRSGLFKQISPKIKTFYFPLSSIKSIPDVILWYYSESDLDLILNVTGGNLEDILDDEGFVKLTYWPALIDNYLLESKKTLENIRSWEF